MSTAKRIYSQVESEEPVHWSHIDSVYPILQFKVANVKMDLPVIKVRICNDGTVIRIH